MFFNFLSFLFWKDLVAVRFQFVFPLKLLINILEVLDVSENSHSISNKLDVMELSGLEDFLVF